MEKRFLLIHPRNEYNCGDLLTYLGTRYFLTEACGGKQNANFIFFDWFRAHNSLDDAYLQGNFGRVDAIVLGGTPWIWDRCMESRKYKMLIDFIARYPDAKRIGLGLGSCVPLAIYQDILMGQIPEIYVRHNLEKVPQFTELFSKFDLLYTRDILAQYFCEFAGVKSHYVYDTSLYAKQIIGRFTEERPSKAILIFTDPGTTISGNYLSFTPKDYIDYQLQWAKDNQADIYTIFYRDTNTLDKLNIPYSFASDIHFLQARFRQYTKMLSSRIHMAVLGLLCGIKDITVLPIDSRFMTIMNLPFEIRYIGPEWRYIAPEPKLNFWDSVNQTGNQIISEIKQVLGE